MKGRQTQERLLDRLVDEEFKKLSKEIYSSLQQRRQHRIVRQYSTQALKKRSNSLPFIRKKVNLQGDKCLITPNPAIMIDT